ncbi:glycosyltransferase [Halioxenophilus aromaticivorans]|uniref:Glycosyltransferase family 2 protein n=1 Tax=Halioxenophilus aromaticivorans TaxID=1306992 RepID=A0AAV3TZ93_9ALTE
MQSVCACIVTYNPEIALKSLVESLLLDFGSVCIVDNGSRVDLLGIVNIGLDGVHIIRLDANLGVAAGLNEAVQKAKALGFEWVCCFDQDSDYVEGSMSEYIRASLGQRDRVVGSGYEYPAAVKFSCSASSQSKSLFIPVRTVITSGSFFSVSLWELVGGFDDDLFIDSVDHDFCLKTYAAGGDVVRLKRNTIRHKVGFGQSFLGVPLHSPLRKYYIFRNVILMVKRHGLRFPYWSAKQIARLVFEFASLLCFEGEKTEKLKLATKGAWHGVKGVKGKYV